MQIEELIEKSFVQKGKRIDHRKLTDTIKLSVRTTTRFSDDEINKCRKFLKDTNNHGYLEIIKRDFRDSNLSFKNIDKRYNSGELTLNEARNSLLPIFIMNSVLTHLDLEFIDFDEILVTYMELIKEDYFDISSFKQQHFVKRIEIKVIYLILEEINNYLLDKVYPLNAEYQSDEITHSFMDLPEALEKSMETLTEREVRVLKLRFGFEDGRTWTYEEVGKEFKVTRERIRQMEMKAIRKLRHPSRCRDLKIYLDKNSKPYSGIDYLDVSSTGKIFTKILSWDDYEASKKDINTDEEPVQETLNVKREEKDEEPVQKTTIEETVEGEYTNAEILFIENSLGIDMELLDLNLSEWPCICAMNLYRYIHTVPASDVIITFRNCNYLNSFYKLLNINIYLWEAFRDEYKIRNFLKYHTPYDKLEKLIEFK